MKKRLKPVCNAWKVVALPVKICCYPGCFKELGERNRAKVCVKHLHQYPHCACGQCVHSGNRQRLRIKTREEMVKEGLLPA